MGETTTLNKAANTLRELAAKYDNDDGYRIRQSLLAQADAVDAAASSENMVAKYVQAVRHNKTKSYEAMVYMPHEIAVMFPDSLVALAESDLVQLMARTLANQIMQRKSR